MTPGVRLPAAVLVTVLVPLLVACGAGGDGGDGGGGGDGGDGLRLGGAPVELQVTVQDWSGWQREQPEPETRSVTVGLGDSFTVDTLGDDVTVTVLALNRNEIELGTSSDLAPESGLGGADHNRLRSTFDLRRDDAVEFSTPTLDAGTTVRIAEVG
jgi:hypothetical protein